MPHILSAADLFSIAHSTKNEGEERCHWCGSCCSRRWIHDDEPLVLFVKTRSTAKCPANNWICVGCWLYRRTRITVQSWGGRQIDRQDPKNHSWMILESDARVILGSDYPALYSTLLSPPLKFSLSFITTGHNLLQLAVANDLQEIKANTPLKFTYNNVVSEYTVYELEQALMHGTDGKAPGVRLLVELMGNYEPLYNKGKEMLEIENQKKAKGRPKGSKEDVDARVLLKKIR